MSPRIRTATLLTTGMAGLAAASLALAAPASAAPATAAHYAAAVAGRSESAPPPPPGDDPDGALPNLALATQPPTCVSASDHHPGIGLATVTVHNNCGTPQRVKVLIAFWFDSSCTTIKPHGSFEYDYANSARFDGLTAC